MFGAVGRVCRVKRLLHIECSEVEEGVHGSWGSSPLEITRQEEKKAGCTIWAAGCEPEGIGQKGLDTEITVVYACLGSYRNLVRVHLVFFFFSGWKAVVPSKIMLPVTALDHASLLVFRNSMSLIDPHYSIQSQL